MSPETGLGSCSSQTEQIKEKTSEYSDIFCDNLLQSKGFFAPQLEELNRKTQDFWGNLQDAGLFGMDLVEFPDGQLRVITLFAGVKDGPRSSVHNEEIQFYLDNFHIIYEDFFKRVKEGDVNAFLPFCLSFTNKPIGVFWPVVIELDEDQMNSFNLMFRQKKKFLPEACRESYKKIQDIENS
ncbi:hypothetical protein K8R20_00685 [bacterium]|nr:hypothetical protein [bacterium]